jgi:hypothetical protein
LLCKWANKLIDSISGFRHYARVIAAFTLCVKAEIAQKIKNEMYRKK